MILKIVRKYDLILLGGYYKKEYVFISILCKMFHKKYVLVFDGINPRKVKFKENLLKFSLKKFVITSSFSIFGNGKVSKLYFTEKFKYPSNKIFNQYLTVDIETIMGLSPIKEKIIHELKAKYGIDDRKNIILYSGRLISIKNVEMLISALSKIKDNEKYLLLIVGDGEEKEKLVNLASKLGISSIFTGFIKEQLELFKFYYISDLLVLPSNDDPWGLVVNEAMAATLPVITTDSCGASLDLVKNGYNGFVVETGNETLLAEAIKNVFKQDYKTMGQNSFNIIQNWTFENSKSNLIKILHEVKQS
jgi:glycosyltransferase involved in cell wall biosynthesis